ncbi:MAG: M23 family metallopeptidase [Bacteroidia bacterium]|nr:M23 family metallopeptidase [Bacteroidia bacterium]
MHPKDAPYDLSGSFGELRSNHFHSGLDYKTEGREGMAVCAAADGWVSRIKVSSTGFGYALYLDHPSGHTSVYAHLHHFNAALSAYLDSAQNAEQSFEIELFPDSGRFVYQAGELLAFSGNTGSSQGPHLHFEIRDRQSQEPLNPRTFLHIQDSIPPMIAGGIFYAKAKHQAFVYPFDCFSDSLPEYQTAYDSLFLDVFAFDPEGENVLGIYRAELFLDDSLLYAYSFNRFHFDETRFVNAHAGWFSNEGNKGFSHHLFKLPGNAFSAFTNAGTGTIVLKDTVPHQLKIRVSDYNGNRSESLISIKQSSHVQVEKTMNDSLPFIPFGTEWAQSFTNGLKLRIPRGALYQDLPLDTPRSWPAANFCSDIYFFLPQLDYPLHVAGRLEMPYRPLPFVRPEQYLLIKLNYKGGNYKTEEYILPDSLEAHTLLARFRKGGMYAVTSDTTSPFLLGPFSEVDPVDQTHYSVCTLKDLHSGIKSYRVEINHEWMLAYFDSKSGNLRWKKGHRGTGPQLISIYLADRCGNTAKIELIE